MRISASGMPTCADGKSLRGRPMHGKNLAVMMFECKALGALIRQ